MQKKIVVFSVLGAKDLHKVVQRTDLKILMDNSTKMYLGVFLHLEKEEEYDLLLVKKLELYFPVNECKIITDYKPANIAGQSYTCLIKKSK